MMASLEAYFQIYYNRDKFHFDVTDANFLLFIFGYFYLPILTFEEDIFIIIVITSPD